jgi:phosphoribosylformylglycinamidine cyclo-ligase
MPHRSYYPSLIDLCNKKIIQGLAHITGSGYQGNIPRILPDNVDVIIDRTTWDPPMIFKLIQQAGSVEKDEMYSTFNMGMGMLVFIDPADKAEVVAHLEAKGEKWTQIGEVVAGTKQVKFRD